MSLDSTQQQGSSQSLYSPVPSQMKLCGDCIDIVVFLMQRMSSRSKRKEPAAAVDAARPEALPQSSVYVLSGSSSTSRSTACNTARGGASTMCHAAAVHTLVDWAADPPQPSAWLLWSAAAGRTKGNTLNPAGLLHG